MAIELQLRRLLFRSNHLGSLNKIERIVKVNGFINCVPTYTDVPLVLNGASDLLKEVFGAKGEHARSSIGVNSLPLGMPVEIEMDIDMKQKDKKKELICKKSIIRIIKYNYMYKINKLCGHYQILDLSQKL